MSYVTIVVGDKSTGQILDQDSGLGVVPPDRIYVPLTGAFAPADLVWVSDDDSPGELGTIQAIVADDYLDMTANLAALYSVAQNAKVVLARNISNDAIDVDTWRNRLSCIGTSKLRFDNLANKYEGLFDPDDPIIISINGTIVWAGLMDDVRPYLPKKGVLTNELFMTGRDHGRYLVDNEFTKKYPTGWAADIVDDILSILGDPLLYTDDGQYIGEAQIKYEGTRAKLGDALREICELSGRDFYIDNNGRLVLFQAGQVDSTVDLFLIATDPTNNLLTFEEYEKVGTSIKNSIEIHAGSVKDHYSDGNSSDLSVSVNGAVADSATHIYGSQSIEFTCTDPATFWLEFDQNPVLADYGYSGSVDLSKLCEAKVMLRGTRTGKTVFSLRPFLVDGGGNKIVFCRVGPDSVIGGKGGSKGWTENIVTWDHRAFWTQLSYPLGAHDSNPIKPGPGLTTGFWNADTGDITFDWTDVVDVGFEYPFTENAVILIDGWCIPSIEAKSIQQDAASQDPVTGYGKRMISQFRKEMRTQKQIILYAKKLLALRKDPIQKFKGVAKGQVGTKYAAQSVDVNVPAYGIIDEPYTITALHHKLHHGRDVRGWDFLTEYELAAQDAPATIILIDDNPLEVGMDRLALENRGYKGGMEAEDSLLGDIQSGRFTQETRGTPFALYPADGDLHWLTADLDDAAITGFQYYGVAAGILYTYDDSIPKWIRAPCELGRRAANPPAGSGGGPYTGDTYYNTTDSKFYQWTGVAWEAIASMDLGDFAGDLDDIPDGVTYARALDAYLTGGKPDILDLAQVVNGLFTADAPGRSKFAASFINGNLILANVVAASHMIAMTHAIEPISWTWNAGVPQLEWAEFIISYKGTNYTVAAGNTQLKYLTWDFSIATNALQVSADEPGQGANPALTDDDIFIAINYQDGSWDEPVTNTIISGPSITTDWITARKFRTANLVGEIGGPAGIRFNANEIAGYSGGVTKQFYLQTADGKAMAGGGKVILDSNGVHIIGDAGAMLTIHKTSLLDPRGTLWNGTINGIENIILSDGALGFGAVLQAGASYFQVKPGGSFYFAGPSLLPVGGPPNIGAVGTPFGDIWGSVHYADMYLSDIHCDKCGELFKQANDVIFTVKGFRDYEEADLKEIVLVPVHRKCPIIPRIKRWLNGLLR